MKNKVEVFQNLQEFIVFNVNYAIFRSSSIENAALAHVNAKIFRS